ncbi:hypothetical protein RhiirA5_420566 [Rhizophagus irregularis]|uniref:Uncharacterized protein n=1 Tax=Rhizophagus irregularis TaxID=588596 RepID=A0A2I1F2W9_9GLOM|nr:hypothetical protein RhiirA5_420566 [Rhizophagus irregularis]PKC61377.1 hypothetical protein RhiirA1_466655 [Rhizophagus irregularis]PKY28721.1 hypothetical protein RhiirB3_445028 [Rhizophagus irregularis]
MGNNKKKSKQPQKQSIPVQEFVNSFTNAFAPLLVELLEGLCQDSDRALFVNNFLNSHIPEGDRVKPNIHTKKFVAENEWFSEQGVCSILSTARHKACQQLDHSTADPSTAEVHLNQKGDLAYQNIMPSTLNTIGNTVLPTIIQPESKSKNTFSHDKILDLLKEWDKS